MFGALIVLLEYVNKRNMLIVSANVQSAAFVLQNEGKTNITAETKTSRNLV